MCHGAGSWLGDGYHPSARERITNHRLARAWLTSLRDGHADADDIEL
jgi:hypothetical protein